MKAMIRIVTPAAATAAAALLLTACADKPVRVPGGTFVEEPYRGEAVASTQTQTPTEATPSTGTEIVENETIYIEDDVPVGPVENNGPQGGASGQQDGQQDVGTQLQPVEDDQQSAAKSNVPEGSVEYKVVKGDTLWGIGMVYGVPVARLAEINGIDEKAPLKIGQTLMIPPDAKNAVGKPIPQKKTEPAKTDAKADSKTDAKAATTTKTDTKTSTATKTTPATKDGETLYVVKKGDSLSVIAQRHHVKLADLVAANNVDPKAILRVGQTLVIPAAGAKAASSATTTKTATTTTTKTEPAATKPATTTTAATTTKTEPATTTKPATASQTKGGEGSGGIVEPIGGSSMGGSASTSTPAASASTSASSATGGLAPVSSTSDDIFAVPINSEATLEEVARNHDKNLEDLIRLNPEFKPGQKIPAGTAVKMPLF